MKKDLDLNTWLNLEINNNEKHYHVLLDIFDMIVNNINNTEDLEIVDIDQFKLDYLKFMYFNSNKNVYKYL